MMRFIKFTIIVLLLAAVASSCGRHSAGIGTPALNSAKQDSPAAVEQPPAPAEDSSANPADATGWPSDEELLQRFLQAKMDEMASDMYPDYHKYQGEGANGMHRERVHTLSDLMEENANTTTCD